MRSVPADEIKRRKKCKSDGEEAAWLKWIYIANGWNNKPGNANKPQKTLSWCRAMFQKEQGHWPRDGMKNMPETATSADWRRVPSACFPWMRKNSEQPA
jgi:hypothetical protein